MVCNNLTNVSIAPTSSDPDAHAILIPDMFLSGDYSTCNPDFTMRLLDFNDNVILDYDQTLRVDCGHLSQFKIEVTDNNSMNSCWGTIDIQDLGAFCGTNTNCTLACNDMVNVSIAPASGSEPLPYFIINSDMILEGSTNGCSDLSLSMHDLNGAEIFANETTIKGGCDLIGDFVLSVTENGSMNSCWGQVSIEDVGGYCGTSSSCNTNCIASITVSLSSSGSGATPSAKIFFNDILEGDVNGCNMEIKLEDQSGNTILDYGPDPFIIVTCDLLGTYVVVVRNKDNQNTCWGQITIQDKTNACNNLLNRIVTDQYCDEFDVELNGVMNLNNDSGCEFKIHDSQIVLGQNQIKIKSNSESVNAMNISTLDMVTFFVNLENGFDDPKKAIAADVDGSGALGTNDLIIMQKSILDLNTIPLKIHKIIPAGFQFPVDFDQFNFENDFDQLTFNDQDIINNDINVEVIKVGELTTLWNQNDKPKAIKNLYYEDVDMVAGEEYTVDFSLTDLSKISALTLGLEINDVVINDVIDDYDGAMLYNIDADQIKLSVRPGKLGSEFLFSLNVVPTQSGRLSDMIQLLGDFHNDLVEENLSVHDIQLVENLGTSNTDLIVLEDGVNVYPNPSSQIMNIEFTDSFRGETKEISFYNYTGQLLHSLTTAEETIVINRNQVSSGVIFMQIQSGNKVYQRKLMFVD